MTTNPEETLDRLVERVLASARYRQIAPDFVRHVGARELARRRNLKEAVKATKSKLHQVAGAYLAGTPHYDGWLRTLRTAAEVGEAALRQACVEIMRHHASTRERLPILDEFYATTLAEIAPVRSVLDVACGLNPLAIPWMPLAEGATYIAYDIYRDMADFLNEFLTMMPVEGRAHAGDVLQVPLDRHVDVALVLKTIPCLEQVDRESGARLLEALAADHILVSFPVRSLGGRDKGMLDHYEAAFRALTAGRPWTIRRFEFAAELAFLISRR